MREHARAIGEGLVAGAVGLAAMEAIQRLTRPLVRERPKRATDVFLTERSMSPFGPQHEPDESATAAVGRIAYQKLAGRPPSPRVKRALEWGIHFGYGLCVAALYAVVRRGRARDPVRDGAVFGAALWLLGDELVVPLLGLADKPTAYSASTHAAALAGHLGFGITTAAVTRRLDRLDRREKTR